MIATVRGKCDLCPDDEPTVSPSPVVPMVGGDPQTWGPAEPSSTPSDQPTDYSSPKPQDLLPTQPTTKPADSTTAPTASITGTINDKPAPKNGSTAVPSSPTPSNSSTAAPKDSDKAGSKDKGKDTGKDKDQGKDKGSDKGDGKDKGKDKDKEGKTSGQDKKASPAPASPAPALKPVTATKPPMVTKPPVDTLTSCVTSPCRPMAVAAAGALMQRPQPASAWTSTAGGRALIVIAPAVTKMAISINSCPVQQASRSLPVGAMWHEGCGRTLNTIVFWGMLQE